MPGRFLGCPGMLSAREALLLYYSKGTISILSISCCSLTWARHCQLIRYEHKTPLDLQAKGEYANKHRFLARHGLKRNLDGECVRFKTHSRRTFAIRSKEKIVQAVTSLCFLHWNYLREYYSVRIKKAHVGKWPMRMQGNKEDWPTSQGGRSTLAYRKCQIFSH